jgi:small subunit ribosomal protein S19
MSRSIWKGPYISPCIYRKTSKLFKTSDSISLQVYSRNSLIMPQFVGQKVVVHNGQHFFPINIKEEMVGHKFGEFSFTKKKPIHKKKNN